MGNGISHFARLFAGFRILHFNRDELGRTLAITDNRLRQFQGQRTEQGFELRIARIGGIVDFALTATACRHNDEAVVGAGIAVHGNRIETLVCDFLRHQLQNRLGHFGIGGDKRQHGRHVRMNHARAFGDAGSADCVFFADQARA